MTTACHFAEGYIWLIPTHSNVHLPISVDRVLSWSRLQQLEVVVWLQ